MAVNAALSGSDAPPGGSRGIGSSTEMLASEKENKCCERSGSRWVDGGMSDGEMSDDERIDCERSDGERSDGPRRWQTYFPGGHAFYMKSKTHFHHGHVFAVVQKHAPGGSVF